jgi:hypothetical protein
MYARGGLALLVVVSALALTSARVATQTTKPTLGDYYKELPSIPLDAGYLPRTLGTWWFVDLNGDGNQDLVVIGGSGGPQDGVTAGTFAAQPGRVFFGDGDGRFTPAPADLFPVDTLKTVVCRQVIFTDFNADGQPDMFIPCAGWDAPPFPGEQNQLFLSRAAGGWRDATATLPQISDFSHSATVGDISGRGVIDIFVGNAFSARGLPYALLNNGSGQFTQTRSNIPASIGQGTGFGFGGATLTDLNDDGLPELILTSENAANFRRTTIFWNRVGTFSDNDKTELPLPGPFTQHIDLNVERIDANLDGLQDLVIVGTQGEPGGPAYYSGSFLQLLINRGNRQFADETADRIPPGEASRGIDGVRVNTAPYAKWVHVLDFNRDGLPDISMEFGGGGSTRDQPFIWLNDGTGHFTVLKIGDFVAAGREYTISGEARLVPTKNGYSFLKIYPSADGLMIEPLMATKPYRTPAKILPGASIRSENGRFHLVYQADGNLVLSDGRSGTAFWATDTGGTRPGQTVMQADGDFVMFDDGGVVRWASGTAGNPGAYVSVQDDGSLVIVRTDGQTIWHRPQ